MDPGGPIPAVNDTEPNDLIAFRKPAIIAPEHGYPGLRHWASCRTIPLDQLQLFQCN